MCVLNWVMAFATVWTRPTLPHARTFFGVLRGQEEGRGQEQEQDEMDYVSSITKGRQDVR